MKPYVLVVDDEELIRWSVKEYLQSEGYEVAEAKDGTEALESVRARCPDAILLDLRMPGLGGIDVLKSWKIDGLKVPVVVLTADRMIDRVVQATQLGASGYLTKPFDLREIQLTLQRVIEEDRLRREVQYLREQGTGRYGDLVGSDPQLLKMFETLERLERVDVSCLLVLGEAGTGRGLVARTVRDRGRRRNGPFVTMDCSKVAADRIIAELFGLERGDHESRSSQKHGLLETAQHGVLYLKRIDALPLNAQARLCKALETGHFTRVDGTTKLPMDLTIIGASDSALEEGVHAGRFDEDLYRRLSVVSLRLSPLRERLGDLAELSRRFIEDLGGRYARPVKGVSDEAIELMMRYAWPGNVCELRSVLERCALLSSEPVIEAADLPTEIRLGQPESPVLEDCPFVLPQKGIQLESVERSLLIQALERTDHNQSAAARLLGISRYALRYRMDKFGLMPAKGD